MFHVEHKEGIIMNNIFEMISNNQGYYIIGLALIILILLILIIILFKSIISLEKRYKKIMRGTNAKNLEELIISYLDKVDEAQNTAEGIKKNYEDIDMRLKGCMQHVSIIRYKAFENVGSDLSFSIALLDDNNNGVVLTGIYGRNDSTTYAKPIDNGISRYDLSDEEKHVLQEAMGKDTLKGKRNKL
jgi:hypothetical protein